jgi:signal transduction histidine kinase
VASPPHRTSATPGPEREAGASAAQLEAENAELRRTIAALAEERDRLNDLFEFGAQLAAHTDVSELAEAVLEEIAGVAGAGFGMIHVRRDQQYRLAATRGFAIETVPETVEEGVQLAGEALAERRPRSTAAGPGEELCLPLVHRGKPLGVLTLLRSPAPLSGARRRTLERLLEQAAASLAQALAYAEVRRHGVVVKAVLDATRDPILMADAGGRIVLENRAAWELRRDQDPSANPVAAELARLTAPLVEAPDAYLAMFERVAEDELYAGSDEYRFVESGRSFQRYTAPVVAPGGEAVGRILVQHEVSAERESERLKDEFVALVSHELRTPLTSIMGYVETLLDGEVGALSEEQGQFLRVVDRNAERLLSLVGDLLFVANLDAGSVALDRCELDVDRLVAECVDAARPSAEGRGVELRLSGIERPAFVDGDAARLGQVVDNLISNALKFTAAGGSVAVRVRTKGETVAVEVEDTGIGIPEGEQARVFERFFRASSATARAVPGSGLGLSVARAIVEAHGGSVGVASVEGAGSTFHVELPVVRAVAA